MFFNNVIFIPFVTVDLTQSPRGHQYVRLTWRKVRARRKLNVGILAKTEKHACLSFTLVAVVIGKYSIFVTENDRGKRAHVIFC